MNDWLDTTLDAPREGGNSLLNPGVGNYAITEATIGVNQWNGRNELTLRISGSGGSGKTTIPLEPWSADALDTFMRIFNSSLGNIGIAVEGRTAKQVLAALPKELPGVVGNIIEINVVHSDRKPKPDGSHLKQDGTPWTDQKEYINRLVKASDPAPVAAPAMAGVAAPSGFDPSDFASVGTAPDDDIPFHHKPFPNANI